MQYTSQRLFRQIVMVSLCLGTVVSTLGIINQKQDRVLEKESWRNEPIKVSNLKVKGRKVTIGQKFSEDDDWLNNLTISIKNTSDKAILFLEMAVVFPRSNDNEPEYTYRLKYGSIPAPPGTAPISNMPDMVKPNETIDIVLSEEEYNHIKDSLRMSGYPANTERVQLSLAAVIFDDETMWRGGHILHRDPNDPEKWKTDRPKGNTSNRNPRSFDSDYSIFSAAFSLTDFKIRKTIFW